MATPYESVALSEIMLAAEKLEQACSVAGSAEYRRDKIKEFITSIFNAAGDLAHISGADALVMLYDHPTVMQSIDDAFVDAIDAEDAAEPRIDPVRQFGTYNAINGMVA